MEPMEVVRRVASDQDGVVTSRQALAAGLTRDQVRQLCRSGRWHRLGRGSYLTAQVGDRQHRRALIRAAVTALGPRAVAVLGSAAELHGIAGLRRSDEIHVSVPVSEPRPQRVADRGVVVHQLTVARNDLVAVAGIPATSAVRTVADLLLRVDRFSAVSVLDCAINRSLVRADDLAAVAVRLRGRRGALAARRYLGQADGRAQSPLETRVRLRCVDGRVPPDDLQHEIRDADGYLLGVADLVWRRARLAAEADGAGPHATPQALYEDRRRQNRLANAGWQILRFTWPDTLRPDYIPHTIHTALRTRTPQHPHS